MRFYGLGGVIVAVALVMGSHAVSAADEPKPADTATGQPKAIDLIFERKHLTNVETGGEVVYKFKRTASDEKVLGVGFADDITLKVTGEKPDNNKDLMLQIYTGDRARDPQKLEKFSINPVFAVYFAQAVNTFSQLAGGQVNYLQKSFSDGWLKAKVEPVKIDYKGKKIDAHRISMTPFVGDKYEVEDAGLGRRQVRRHRQRPGARRDRRSARHLSQPLSAGAAEAFGTHDAGWSYRIGEPLMSKGLITGVLALATLARDGRRRPGGRAARQRLPDQRARRLRVRLHADERPDAR